MAQNPDSSHLNDMEDLRDEIALYEGTLESLLQSASYDDYDSETEDSVRATKKTLKNLRRQLRALESPPTPPQIDGPADMPPQQDLDNNLQVYTPISSTTQNSTSSSTQSDRLVPPSYHDPSSRKRQRSAFDVDATRGDSNKSRRTTPNVSSAPSPAPSHDSLDSLDDPFLSSIFGEFSTQGAVREQKYMSDLEKKKQQEKDDLELAQKLSQEWNQGDILQQKSSISPFEYSQPFLNPNGSLNRRPTIPSEVKVEPTTNLRSQLSTGNRESWSSTPIKNEPSGLGSNSPAIRIKPEPSSRSVTSIPASQVPDRKPQPYMLSSSSINTNRYLSSQNTQNTPLTTTPGASPLGVSTMPGAFPGGQAYSSIGGNAVYNSAPYNSATSALAGASQLSGLSSSFPSPYGSIPNGSFNRDSSPNPYGYSDFHYSDPSKTKEELEELMKHIRPDEELAQHDLVEVPAGLKATLMPHQLKGLAWMSKMEEGSNKGGILADDMGLGKTVQSIALLLARPPAQGFHSPTLIVAPVALIKQWEREMEKMVKTRHRLSILIYHGSSKKVTWPALKSYDVVLTTYGLLASELKRQLAWEEKVKKYGDIRPTPAEQCSILGDRSHFHRIILDEAQNIKNRMAKAALAACRIKADHRWALSGTPMQNNVEEMYSLIKFCRIKPYNDWNLFNKDIGGPIKRKGKNRYDSDAEQDKAMQTLQALLRAILLRRTKTATIDGKPILQLPSKTTTEERVAFDEDQLTFYKALENKAQIQFNKFLQSGRGGSIGQNYSNALVLLLRLRQACCHPRLVVDSSDFMIQMAGTLAPQDLMDNARELDSKVVARLKGLEAFECPICMDASENPAVFPCGHTLCNECLSKLIDQFTNNEEDGRQASPNCPHCRAKIDSKKVTDINSFLRVHDPTRPGIPTLDGDDEVEADDSGSDSETDEDDEDGDEGSDLGGFIVHDDVEDDSETSEKKTKSKKAISKPKKGKKKSRSMEGSKPRVEIKSLAVLRKEGLRNKTAKRKYLKRLRKTFQPSAKTTKTIELLEQIRARGEKEKTIVFSNFTSFLDLLEVPLHDHKAFRGYVRYDGSMSATDRNDAVLEFTDNPHCTVILVSLKAGNAGLNLTAANHVVMLDPFWNPFVEYQAADRCYRIGQVREVNVHRILISGEGFEHKNEEDGYTVEDRILALQEKKRDLVDTALDESAGRNVARLGVRELGYLFGLNRM